MKATVVQHEAGITTTEMIGAIMNQEALMGLLNTLYDTGHVLIFVRLLTAAQIEEVNPEESNS